MLGTVLHGIRAARQLARASRICGPVADGMAMMISSTVGWRRFRRRTTENAWRPDPRTGTPIMRACCFSGIVIQEALDLVPGDPIGMDFANQFGSGGASSVDQDPGAPLAGTLPSERLVADSDGKSHQRGAPQNTGPRRSPGPIAASPVRSRTSTPPRTARSRRRCPETRDTGPGCLRIGASRGRIPPNRRWAISPESRSAGLASGSGSQLAGIEKSNRSRKAAVTDSTTAARWQARSSQTSI